VLLGTKQQHRDRSPDDAGDMEPRSPLAKSPFRCDFLSRLVFYYIIMSVITLKRKHGRVNRSKTKKIMGAINNSLVF